MFEFKLSNLNEHTSVLLVCHYSVHTENSTMTDTPNEVRAKIIALWEHADKSTRQIADDLGLVQSTVSRIIKRYRETGSHQSDRELCHRPRKTNERDDRVLLRISVKKPHASSLEIANELR